MLNKTNVHVVVALGVAAAFTATPIGSPTFAQSAPLLRRPVLGTQTPAAEGALREWVGTYEWLEEGVGPMTLTIAESGGGCLAPRSRAFSATLGSAAGSSRELCIDLTSSNATQIVLYDDRQPRDPVTGVWRWKRYIGTWSADKTKVEGTFEYQGSARRGRFSAVRAEAAGMAVSSNRMRPL